MTATQLNSLLNFKVALSPAGSFLHGDILIQNLRLICLSCRSRVAFGDRACSRHQRPFYCFAVIRCEAQSKSKLLTL